MSVKRPQLTPHANQKVTVYAGKSLIACSFELARTMTGRPPSPAESWREGAREQERWDGKEIQVWKERVPMQTETTYKSGVHQRATVAALMPC